MDDGRIEELEAYRTLIDVSTRPFGVQGSQGTTGNGAIRSEQSRHHRRALGSGLLRDGG
jgi:hypothetical protein